MGDTLLFPDHASLTVLFVFCRYTRLGQTNAWADRQTDRWIGTTQWREASYMAHLAARQSMPISHVVPLA